jgi:VIT1/CCC1 family predicted Fe2+/Mn2+ transporter
MPEATPDNRRQAKRRSQLLSALAMNWQTEMSGYFTYKTLAERDDDPIRKQMLLNMAAAEEEHAALWGERITALGGNSPKYHGKVTGDADSLANRLGGQRMALRRLEIDESRAIAHYGQQLKELDDEPSLVVLRHVIEEEKEHYRELSSLIRQRYPQRPHEAASANPQMLLTELLARRSGSGRQAAGWIGDAIYGINDGLGAIFGIVSGVSGATVGNSKYVLLAGIAGMVASALSMGSGAYLAAKSEREIYQAEVEREREAIEMNAPESRELLSLYYQVKGLPEDDADRFVDHIAKDKTQFLRALASERLNTTEDALRKPAVSAISAALSTALGAFVPIIPFFFSYGYRAILISAVISLAAHFAVGAAKSLITVRSWWASGMEMTLIGAAEGVVTYVIGIGLGRAGA